jgi:hypothetical protein
MIPQKVEKNKYFFKKSVDISKKWWYYYHNDTKSGEKHKKEVK